MAPALIDPYKTMITVLAIADVHIGRYPSRVKLSSQDLSVRTVWNASVDYAIENRVNAVALTGDIVDNSDKYFEAYGTLRYGVEKLRNAGIPVFAVSGNHDYDIFPRLAADIGHEHFHLLGQGGKWETKPLRIGGRVAARFTGWSFFTSHHADSPLRSFRMPKHDEPVIGLVHGDLGTAQGKGKYAPLALSELQRQPVAFWLLGHIHKPRYIPSGGTPVLYPGSLQPLDPGETGKHGPWMLSVWPNGDTKATPVPLATVRYAKLTVDLTNADNIDDVHSILADQVSSDAEQLSRRYERLRHVSYRLLLTGRTALHGTLIRHDWESVADLDTRHGDLRLSIDKVSVRTTPARNLENIARFTDPPGTVSRWMLEMQALIEGGPVSDECSALLDEAEKAANKVVRATRYTKFKLEYPELDRTTVAALLIRQGSLLVDTLMAQKEKTHE